MLYGILYFYSIDLQQYRHYSTLAAALAFLPMTILMAVLGPVAGRLSARFSPVPVIVAGLMNSPMSNAAVSSADARHSGAASATHNTFKSPVPCDDFWPARRQG